MHIKDKCFHRKCLKMVVFMVQSNKIEAFLGLKILKQKIRKQIVVLPMLVPSMCFVQKLLMGLSFMRARLLVLFIGESLGPEQCKVGT